MKKNNTFVKVNHFGIMCKKCGSIIYSRTSHDMRGCSCNSCYVDGGFDYLKVSGDPNYYETIKIIFKCRAKGDIKDYLWSDWFHRDDKYGLVDGFTYLIRKYSSGKNKIIIDLTNIK